MAFRGASADSFAVLTEEFGRSGAGQSPETAGTVGGDLFRVAEVLRAEPSLRRVATDVSVDARAKAGLVDQLFTGKVHEATLPLVRTAVERRWTAPRELADALEELGVVATVKSAGEEGARLSDELFTFDQAVKDNDGLRDALSDPARSPEDKRALVRSLLEGKALPATVTLAEQSLSGSHRTVNVALGSYQEIAATAQGENVATVYVARPLADADRERLVRALSSQYGRDVHINVVVDPDVVGGIKVEIGDDVIDGTVSSRLDDARRKMAS